jgi:hypothetical protein
MSRKSEIDLHDAMEDHFSALGKGFRAAASNHSDTSDELDDGHELKQCLKTDAGIANAMGTACEKIAAWHASKGKALKIADADELSKANGSAISSVAPSDAPPEAFGIAARPRAVPRYGQPDPAVIDSIDPKFRHLVTNDE